MKKVLAILAAAVIGLPAWAQNTITPIGVVDGRVSQPQTTLYIDITVEQQDIVAGPYARYAQKYLGVSAPLADKVLYEITGAAVCAESRHIGVPLAATGGAVSHMNPAKGFPKLPVDRMSNSQLSLEDNAKLAADRIFSIRKSRYELITAEAGENVFGAGLRSALDELDRLEEEYLSLFLGKLTSRTVSKQYKAVPAQGKQNYIVCRFSNIDGLLPQDDLSGEPVVLEITPAGNVSTAGLPVVDKPAKTDKAFRVADDALCRIIFNGVEIASETIPVYQFGQTVYLR